MKDYKRAFQALSYLQYPFMLAGLLYLLFGGYELGKSLGQNLELDLTDVNKALVLMGLGISLSTLQDTKKMQNNFSKRVYENPRKTKIFLIVLFCQIAMFVAFGLVGLFGSNKYMYELSFGFISIGIGMVGMLKAAMEMAENVQQSMATGN
ncbi:MAG: hypothetical protein ACKOE6_02005 [Flammeovirgaceae bacterium]